MGIKLYLLISEIEIHLKRDNIHGSINIQKDNFQKQEHLLNKGKAIVVISENGLDAGSAGVELQKMGIEEVYLLRNGLISWEEESLPLVK